MAKFLEARRLEARTTPTVPFPAYGGVPRVPGSVKFNPAEQLVSVSGDHAWIAPVATDKRGPCAGLNAAANHNYIPRSGIMTYDAINSGLYEAFGLDQTATQFLQQTTAFFDGDPITQLWSIGGYSSETAALGGLLSVLGTESGIGQYGHLKSEGDASITRGDFQSTSNNNDCASYPEFFQELLDVSCEMRADCYITMGSLAAHQNNRKLYSIATNPNYFSPPFAGIAFTPAAHAFVAALMSSHSDKYPEGFLDPATLMSFFSYTKAANGSLVYTYGHERIPEDWYKRALNDPWTLTDILTEVVQQCASYPGTCEIGGNTGTVNSFAGIDPGSISSAAFNASVYTDPAALGCFLSQNIQAEAPDFLSNVFTGAGLIQVLELVTSKLVPSLAAAFGGCGGINQAGGNGAKGMPMSQYGTKYPGSTVRSSGSRGSQCAPNP